MGPAFPAAFPALYLYPLNDSFVPKHISLLHNQRVKIGRQTNAKTTPGERNGYFDSKVLSRQHAEVWEEGGKIFIRDVKSSNGTFINGERLSPEGLESEPFELKSDDIVEFGIDIVGEDNKTIVHHKVAARVVCIFSEQDAQMAARAEQHQMQQLQHYNPSPGPSMTQPGPSSSTAGPPSATSSFNFSGQQPPRRPQMSQQGISGMGGMGGSMRPPGKSGLTFDHILSRLQGELQKSRETGAELQSVSGAMNEIHDTLGGGNLPTNAPPPPHTLPPVRPQPPPQQQQQQQQPEAPPSEPEAPSSPLLTELQNQLKETQSSLSLHIDKIRTLESALQEQEAMRHEVRVLREMMELVQRRELHQKQEFDSYQEQEDDFDDDNQSVSTVMAHELERVDEEDEEQVLAAEEEDEPREKVDEIDGLEEVPEEDRRQRQEELGRPRTPEPTGLGMSDTSRNRSKTLTARNPPSTGVSKAIIDDLTSRLAALTAQLESALELSNNFQVLQAQHSSAQNMIKSLEEKVERLEGMVSRARDVPEPVDEPPSVTQTLLTFQKSLQGQWSSVQEEWASERERMAKAREEYEARTREAREQYEQRLKEEKEERERERAERKEELGRVLGEIEKRAQESQKRDDEREKRELEREKKDERREKEWRDWEKKVEERLEKTRYLNGSVANGDTRHSNPGGLVTPPSPRSLSSDSADARHRRRRSGSGRGRRRRSVSRGAETDDTEATLANDEPFVVGSISGAKERIVKRFALTGLRERHKEEEEEVLLLGKRTVSGTTDVSASGSDVTSPKLDPGTNEKALGPVRQDYDNRINAQTAFGVLVLSVAAAAVVWRVKPQT